MPRRRPLLLAVVLAALLVAAGCSGTDGDGTFDADGPSAGARAETGTAGEEGAGGPDGTGSPRPAPAGGGGAGSGGGGAQARPATSTTRGPTTTGPAGERDTGARQGPGDYARHILRAVDGAARIVVEVMAQPGGEPTAGTLEHLRQVLVENARKSVTVQTPRAIGGGDGKTTDAEVRSMADANARVAQSVEQAVIRLLFLRGTYESDDSVLGVAVRGDTAAVFSDVVDSAATPLVPASRIEDSVTTHELGHLLGLVDLVLATGRADAQHPGHSRNPDSVMYWAVEADIVTQVLGGPPSRDFDAADRADLAALRGGA